MDETGVLRDEINAITASLTALEDFVNSLAKRVKKLEERVYAKLS